MISTRRYFVKAQSKTCDTCRKQTAPVFFLKLSGQFHGSGELKYEIIRIPNTKMQKNKNLILQMSNCN